MLTYPWVNWKYVKLILVDVVLPSLQWELGIGAIKIENIAAGVSSIDANKWQWHAQHHGENGVLQVRNIFV
jgi:hypothetical protein